MFSAGKSWVCLNLKLPKISKFWKSWEFLSKCKKIEKLENSGGAEICRERADKPYIPKKSSFFSPLIRSGPASTNFLKGSLKFYFFLKFGNGPP